MREHDWVFKEWHAWLLEMCTERGISLYGWSLLAGVDRSYLHKMIRNRIVARREIATQLAVGLGLPPELGLVKAGYIPDPQAAQVLNLVVTRTPYKPNVATEKTPPWFKDTDRTLITKFCGNRRTFEGYAEANRIKLIGRSTKGVLIRVPGRGNIPPYLYRFDPSLDVRVKLIVVSGITINQTVRVGLAKKYL